ncbi:hypothetical protein [Abyssogena phaseoliformis symbiont]|uniref:hypothetical protein n=1 Tax=Abyssogena phaseoliformis symbiont TaxID=596095 RepID=UPI0019157662|nr:hypothetical protein [Abyssogena phaseoliformis symbiont]
MLLIPIKELPMKIGTYKYQEGECIKFYLGDMLLGETKAKLVLYPIDIVTRTDYAVKIS